jgi:hypothetical protein
VGCGVRVMGESTHSGLSMKSREGKSGVVHRVLEVGVDQDGSRLESIKTARGYTETKIVCCCKISHTQNAENFTGVFGKD